MKQFARNLDPLGRVVIPREILKMNHIEPGDLLAIEVVSAGILLSPLTAACTFCGSTEDLLEVDGIGVCRSCAEQLKKKLEDSTNG